MFFDRVANMKGYWVGVILESPEGVHTPFVTKLCYNSTSNMAKYEPCILEFEAALQLKINK